jgi:hypothetical protein
MAAALIPLIAPIFESLAPQVIALITALVHKHAAAAQAQLGVGTGPVKLAQVLTAVNSDLSDAAKAGTIPPVTATGSVAQVVQSVVGSMKLSGLLGASAASPAVAAKTVSAANATTGSLVVNMKPGETITISFSATPLSTLAS